MSEKKKEKPPRKGFSLTGKEYEEYHSQALERGYSLLVHYVRYLILEDRKKIKREQK